MKSVLIRRPPRPLDNRGFEAEGEGRGTNCMCSEALEWSSALDVERTRDRRLASFLARILCQRTVYVVGRFNPAS